MTDHAQTQQVPLSEALGVWARIGLLSFGGPAAQIALMHREIVEQRGWLTDTQFLNATGFCMLLPGPEAMQIATYAGWRLHGVWGGILAGGLFVLPGAFVMLALGMLYVAFGTLPAVTAIFLGVQAAVIAIVLSALIGLSKRALSVPLHYALAVFGFLALFVFDVPFPVVIAIAASLGAFALPSNGSDAEPTRIAAHPRLWRTIGLWLALWAAPLIVLWAFDPAGLLLEIGLFFSKLAVVTFGGAYAVLAYMAQQVVVDFGWLSAGQMMDGLGLAETTPGPLILVTEFVGFLAGFEAGGYALGIAAAALTLWVTFIPCFLWIFAAAPYLDWIATQPRLKGALQGITAAVVGVIANLSLWFACHVIFAAVQRAELGWLRVWIPDLTTVHAPALALAVLALFLMFWLRWSLLRVLAAGAFGGLLLHLFGL